MSGQVRFGSRSRSGVGLGLRRGWLLSRRGVLQGAALSTREEGADSLGLLVPWSRVRLIAFILALTSQATALQEGPPVISPSSQVEIQRWVNVEAVNLRSGPGVNHSVIQVLTVNNPVRVLGKAGRWVQVERAPGEDDAIQGWIFGRFLSDNPLTQKELESLKSTLPAKNRPGGQIALWGFLSIAIFFLAIWIAWKVGNSRKKRRLKIKITELGQAVGERIRTCFLVEPCPRCHEVQNRLLQISPNARSVQLQCTTCNRKYWAGASNPHGYKVGEEHHAFWETTQALAQLLGEESIEVEVFFDVPAGPMPFEQTTREQIPSSLRSEVWRRDEGRCRRCSSRNNLQFDHIIPVSRGGGTTPQNLQLLCKSCNLSKGNKI